MANKENKILEELRRRGKILRILVRSQRALLVS